MAKNDDAATEADRRALFEALASIPAGAPRARVAAAPRERAKATPSPLGPPSARDDEAVIKHITALGSFMTRRMDEVDHRLDELSDLLESLLSSLLEFLLANLPDGPGGPDRANGDTREAPVTDAR